MNILTDINKAADILREGGLVAFPTETVYGLGGDAMNPAAVRKIFDAKERPLNHPLIVHIAEAKQMAEWAMHIPEDAIHLANAFWPGPLTLILKKQPAVLDIVTAYQPTIGLRVPKHPIAQKLLHAFGGGVAAPSANQFTHISPTTAAAVAEELHGRIDAILDGGPCEVGLESTILDLSGDKPVVIRPGMISAEQIEFVLGKPVSTWREDTPKVRAPGMHHLHYAPVTLTLMIEPKRLERFLMQLPQASFPVAVLALNDVTVPSGVEIIQMPKDPTQYAQRLYHTLRSADNQKFKQILIEAVPKDNAWEAIRDRLLKASRNE